MFKLPDDYKINVLLTTLSIVFAVYTVEVFLYINADNNDASTRHAERIRLSKEIGIPFDTRKGREVIQDLEGQGVRAVPFVYPWYHVDSNGLDLGSQKVFPLGGISQIRTVLCNETGEWSIYDSDEYGFNNPRGLFGKEIDILLVGDSFAHGFCVKPEESIAARMRALSQMNVVSVASGANGPLLEFATLKEYGQPLKPRYVLWMYFEENDLKDLQREQTSPFLLSYRDGQFFQNLISKQAKIDLLLTEFLQKRNKKKSRNRLPGLSRIMQLKCLREKLAIDSTPPLKLFTELLQSAKLLTQSWGGQLYFVYLPSALRYMEDLEHGKIFHRNQVLSIVNDLNIPIIDIHAKVFANHRDPLSLFPFGIPGHYTNEGYRLVAQALHTVHVDNTFRGAADNITSVVK